MSEPSVIQVDPRDLFLPPSRIGGADPAKLMRQISAFGRSTAEMPPIFCYRWPDGGLVVSDGVTRATRVAKLMPGKTVPVRVLGTVKRPRVTLPQVKDRLP